MHVNLFSPREITVVSVYITQILTEKNNSTLKPSGAPGPVIGSAAQSNPGHTGESPAKGHDYD